MLLGGLALAGGSEGTRTERAGARVDPRGTGPQGQPAASKAPRGRRRAADSPAAGRVGTPNRRGAEAREIAFKPPIDFDTGPAPMSTAFNLAAGDQIHHVLARAPLSNSVAVGDFNLDGKPDVAETNVIGGTLSIFLGDGRGSFATPQVYPAGEHPGFVTAGDLDLDGDLDLAVASFGSGDVSIFQGNGKGSFQPHIRVAVPTPRNIAIGDFNDDGVPDLAVASSPPGRGTLFTASESTRGSVTILAGDESGLFISAQELETTAEGRPVNANYVAAGDFDKDGRDDLAVGVGISSNAGDTQATDTRRTGDDVVIFLSGHRPAGAAAGQPFTATPQQRIRVGSWPAAIAVADLDHDSEPDLAVLDSSSGDITSLLGDGKGGFVVVATNVTVGALPRSLATGDFNGDGLLDLVTASFMASTVSVLAGEGDGTFQPAIDFWAGDAPTSAATGDFNSDGRVDVVAGRTRTDHLALLLNDGPRRGDGVVIARDISYGSPTHPTNDPFAAHHTLDVYLPPEGTPSFAGGGRPYPVVFFVHGGGGISGDKSMVSYLMRSLARQGLVAVSTNYRLGRDLGVDQVKDVAQAFRWTRDNVSSSDYGGDPNNMFVFGYSAGASAGSVLATDLAYQDERKSIRALVMAGSAQRDPGTAPNQPPSLVLNGTEGMEQVTLVLSTAFSTQSKARGADSRQVIVPGRDHLTIISDMALPGDPARVEILSFLRSHLA